MCLAPPTCCLPCCTLPSCLPSACPALSPALSPALPCAAALQEPAVAEVAQVFERCKDLGVLLGKGGELCGDGLPGAHASALKAKGPRPQA